MSANVGNRAAKELYYKPFAAAVDAGVGSAMCSYNRVNRTWACEEANALAEIHDVMGFAGWMMSDWGATHSTVAAANNGLDQQMPDNSFFGPALVAAVQAGTVTQAAIDLKVTRILTAMFALNLMAVGNSPLRNTSAPANPPEHAILSRELAEKSVVLLQNDGGLLPFAAASAKNVLVLGDENTVAGGGSGQVVKPYVVTAFQGIAAYLNGPQPPAPPATCSMDPDIDYFQADSPSTGASSPQDCCNICGQTAGCKAWTYDAGTCYLKPNSSGRASHPGLTSGNLTGTPSPPPAAGNSNVTYDGTQDAAAAVAAAAGMDLVVMVVATDSSEGGDRGDLFLPKWQDAMVSALAAAGVNLVVVARCPGACHMPWSKAGPMSILFEMLPGQESGNSIANTVFGDNNPSGRLPISFPQPPASGSGFPTDTWLSPVGGGPVIPTMYPGTDRGNGFPEVDYSEELLMGESGARARDCAPRARRAQPRPARGWPALTDPSVLRALVPRALCIPLAGYRWYDAQGTKPQWVFGHGLSYSTFTYSNLNVMGPLTPSVGAIVYAEVCNTAGPAGSEIAQLYLGFPAAANEPPKLLKGFQKVSLGAGGCAGVGFPLKASDLWTWDVVGQQWILTPGQYTVMVGSTSADIRLTGALTVTA